MTNNTPSSADQSKSGSGSTEQSSSNDPSSLSPSEDDPHPSSTSDELHENGCMIAFELFDPDGLLTDQERRSIESWASMVFGQLHATGSVRAKVVDDEAMSEAHLRYSGIPGTTDVLTFDLSDEPACEPVVDREGARGVLDTDLIVCVDEASRQAESLEHSRAHELLLYIVHGALHCLGFDDHTHEDFVLMHRYEDRVLSDAGIGPLFDRSGEILVDEHSEGAGS